MSLTASIEELKNMIGLRDLPDELLQWLLDRGEVREYEDGSLIARTGDPTEHMWILLEGKFDYYMNVNGTLVYYLTFQNDTLTGGITGLLPGSRMKVLAGNWYAVTHAKALLLHKQYFPELEQRYPDFAQRLIGYMTERARVFATIQLQHEKVSALGKLAAGIAHELNNPAAAINRIADDLDKRLNVNYKLTATLLAHGVSAEQIERIRSLAKEKESADHVKITALERMQAEDDIADWFTDNGFGDNRHAAETLSEFGFSLHDLEGLREGVSDKSFIDLLQWLENILSSGRLIRDLKDASGRITHLVGAIKSHVHMDQTNDAQRTNIHTDIENTLALMGYKLRDKHIQVTKDFGADVPMVDAYIGELNQVWTNLIDNAIDAMEKGGELTISTTPGPNDVTIRVVDTGAGIPKEIQSRIFDPFFTTKKVGQGTGIGLDIVKRIITRHHGEIKVESVPGRTEFVVCIPISQHHQ